MAQLESGKEAGGREEHPAVGTSSRSGAPPPPFKDPSLVERIKRVLLEIARGKLKGKPFENREKLLPRNPDPNYYREYDVPTPGIRGRGSL